MCKFVHPLVFYELVKCSRMASCMLRSLTRFGCQMVCQSVVYVFMVHVKGAFGLSVNVPILSSKRVKCYRNMFDMLNE